MSQRELLQRLLAAVGQQGCSGWHVITQEQVALHAAASGDGTGEWIHLDPQRAAREAPYGGTIVQGFLQVAHLVKLCPEAIPALAGLDINHALNYGFDRLRFVNPMPVGSRFRAKVRIAGAAARGEEGCLLTQQVALELESGETTLAADWLSFISPAALGAAGA